MEYTVLQKQRDWKNEETDAQFSVLTVIMSWLVLDHLLEFRKANTKSNIQ